VYPRSQIFTLGEHWNSKTDPFLWGLLLDNEEVLDPWSKKFQASSRNAFALITGLVHSVGDVSRVEAGVPADYDRDGLPGRMGIGHRGGARRWNQAGGSITD
jgi:hypothetical protein